MKRRDFARGLAAGGLAALAPGLRAQPDPYPNRPLRWVVPFVAGGPPDILARTLADPLSASLGQPVVVENRPGASGNLGYEVVAKAAPDGYTLLMASINTHAINPSLYAKVPFDPIRDFTPVTQLALVHNVLVVHLAIPEVRDKLTSRGFEPVGGTPQAFAEVIDRDIAKWSKVVKLSGARID